jgi:nitroreductase
MGTSQQTSVPIPVVCHEHERGRTAAYDAAMELREALRTTGAVRSFEPGAIPPAVVRRILDAARFAPSGGNRQPWRVVVAHDEAVRRGLRESYQAGWAEYLALAGTGLVPFAPVTDDEL